MKIAAGIIGIVAGFVGIAGGFATVFIGAVGEAVEATDAATVTNVGVVAFWVCFSLSFWASLRSSNLRPAESEW